MTYQIGNVGRYANLGSQFASGYDPLKPYTNTLGGIGNAAGVLSGLQRQGGLGYANAGLNAAKLAGRTGILGQYTKPINAGVGDAVNALNIYQGIRQGGVGGYGNAAVNAAQLGSKTGAFGGASGAIGSAAGYAAIPLSLYNEVKNWQSGNTGSDALGGAATGAAIGSVVPGIGTAIGALVGGAAGALSSVFGNGKVAPENANWVGYTDAYNKAGQQGGALAQANLASEVQNPYGALAGYFDLRDNQVKGNNPLYAQYGRMGEQKFTNDLVGKINDATKAGAIGPNDDASSIYSKVVQPWEDSWGRGQSTDQNADAMKGLITQMISQYEGGQAGDSWLARSGDKPFASINKPPTPNVYPPSVQGAPSTGPDVNAIAAAHDAQRASMGVPSATMQPTPTTQVPMSIGAPQSQLRQLGMGRKKGGAIARHFDEGGDTGDYEYDGFNPGNVTDFNSLAAGNSGNDVQDWNSNLSDIQAGLNQNAQFGDQLNTWLDAYDAGNPASKPSGWQTLKNNATGGGGLQGLLKAYAPLLPLIQGAIQQHTQGKPSLPGGLSSSAIGALPQGHFGRTQNMAPSNTGAPMSKQDWYTYGQRPEASFFNNNAVPINQTAVGQAKGGKTPPHMRPGALGQATGAPEFNSAQMNYVGDGQSQPGDGQSDDVDAKLSKGEYVFDAHTVSMLGNGSNSAGAAKLDALRENLRKHAAKSNSKGKQFMGAKDPQHYLPKGKPAKKAVGEK